MPQDYGQAAEWYKKAADRGDLFAESKLGFFYFKGQGVTQDYAQAVVWLRKAAERKDPSAQLLLVMMYSEGLGVPKDIAEADKWRRSLAEQAHDATVPHSPAGDGCPKRP